MGRERWLAVGHEGRLAYRCGAGVAGYEDRGRPVAAVVTKKNSFPAIRRERIKRLGLLVWGYQQDCALPTVKVNISGKTHSAELEPNTISNNPPRSRWRRFSRMRESANTKCSLRGCGPCVRKVHGWRLKMPVLMGASVNTAEPHDKGIDVLFYHRNASWVSTNNRCTTDRRLQRYQGNISILFKSHVQDTRYLVQCRVIEKSLSRGHPAEVRPKTGSSYVKLDKIIFRHTHQFRQSRPEEAESLQMNLGGVWSRQQLSTVVLSSHRCYCRVVAPYAD
jgi:hypothetical protein